jgi:hypothetical protein
VRAVGFHEPEAAPLPESAVPAAAQIPAPGVSAPSAVLPEATSSTGVEPAGVETFEEVIVAGDSPAPPVPAAVAPPVPAAVAPPVPATVAPRALPATVGLRALPVRPPAAAAQLPSSGLEDAPSVASPKGRPSHAKPAPSVAPRPKSLPLGGLQVIGAPASPLFP